MLDDVVTAVIEEHDKDGDGCLSYGTAAGRASILT